MISLNSGARRDAYLVPADDRPWRASRSGAGFDALEQKHLGDRGRPNNILEWQAAFVANGTNNIQIFAATGTLTDGNYTLITRAAGIGRANAAGTAGGLRAQNARALDERIFIGIEPHIKSTTTLLPTP